MARRTSASGTRAATSCPSSSPRRRGRQRWLRDARRRLDERRAREARPIPGPRPKRLKEAKRRLEEDHQVQLDANAAYEDYRRNGRMRNGRGLGAHSPPKPYRPPEAPEGKINLSELDSGNVKTPRGWLQGYNAQAVTTTDQIVIAAEVTIDSPDFGHLEPMIRAARSDLDYAGVTERLQVVLADAGYWHQVQMQRLMSDGLQVLIPPVRVAQLVRPCPATTPAAHRAIPRKRAPSSGRSARPPRTTRERAVRARADDRNRGRKRAPNRRPGSNAA
jgi:hypothetical protein